MLTLKSFALKGLLLLAVVATFNSDHADAHPFGVISTYPHLFNLTGFLSYDRLKKFSGLSNDFATSSTLQLQALTQILASADATSIQSRCTHVGLAEEIPIVIVLGITAFKCDYENITIGCKGSKTLGEVGTLLNCLLSNLKSVLDGTDNLVQELTKANLGKTVHVLLFAVYVLVQNILQLVGDLKISALLYPYLPIILGGVLLGLGFGFFIAASGIGVLLGVVVLVLYALLMPILSPVFYKLAATVEPIDGGLLVPLLAQVKEVLGNIVGNLSG